MHQNIQLIRINVCHLAVIFKYGVLRSPMLGERWVLAGWDLNQPKAHQGLPNTSEYKVLLYLPSFGLNSNVMLWPHPNYTPILGVAVDPVVRVENGTNRNAVYTFDFCAHYRPIWDRLATIHNATDRQTDRQGDGNRLCYSIGGTKIQICQEWQNVLQLNPMEKCDLHIFHLSRKSHSPGMISLAKFTT